MEATYSKTKGAGRSHQSIQVYTHTHTRIYIYISSDLINLGFSALKESNRIVQVVGAPSYSRPGPFLDVAY